jgi:hypothetical protein
VPNGTKIAGCVITRANTTRSVGLEKTCRRFERRAQRKKGIGAEALRNEDFRLQKDTRICKIGGIIPGMNRSAVDAPPRRAKHCIWLGKQLSRLNACIFISKLSSFLPSRTFP